jgi:hypothetical protein
VFEKERGLEQGLPAEQLVPPDAAQLGIDTYEQTWSKIFGMVQETSNAIASIPTEVQVEAKMEVEAIIKARIEEWNGPGFQHGGMFTVGGTGGPDSQLVAFRASPGERVVVQPPSQISNRTVNMGDVNMPGGMTFQQFDQHMRRWLGA